MALRPEQWSPLVGNRIGLLINMAEWPEVYTEGKQSWGVINVIKGTNGSGQPEPPHQTLISPLCGMIGSNQLDASQGRQTPVFLYSGPSM